MRQAAHPRASLPTRACARRLPACLQGDLEGAIAAYERALAAAPNVEVVQHNMAAALTEWGTCLKAAGARGTGSMA